MSYFFRGAYYQVSTKQKKFLYVSSYFLIALEALVNAFSYEIFIFPNDFAPAGVGGISTILQYVTGLFGEEVSAGVFSLIINVPLLIVSFFFLDKDFTFKNLVHTVVFSVALVFYRKLDVHAIAFTAAPESGGRVLAAIAGGVFSGLLYYVSVRLGGATGGADIIAALINKKKPEFDMVWVIFAINVAIAITSFFVYGQSGNIASSYEPVILCLIYCFVSSTLSDYFFKGGKSAIKFEIITTHHDEIATEIIEKLHHGCTIISGVGAYSHSDKKVLICIVNRRQIPACEKILKKYDNTFAFMENVNGTFGTFNRRVK